MFMEAKVGTDIKGRTKFELNFNLLLRTEIPLEIGSV